MARPQRRDQPEAPGPNQWVEEQLQETKARLHKLENELEQALKHVWSMDSDVRTLTETISTSGSATVAVDKLREDTRQLSDQVNRLQDRQNALANRIEENLRSRQAEVGRDRQDLGALAKQLETLDREVRKYDSRIQSLEEAVRHTEDEISTIRLFDQGLERTITALSTKLERTDEVNNRLGEEAARVAGQLDRLEQEDTRVEERINLLTEQLRRHGERLGKLDDLAEFPQEVKDLFLRAAHERELLSQRLNVVDRLSAEASDLVKALKQSVALIEQRSQNQSAQLTEMSSRLQDLEEHTIAQLKKIVKVTLRQRRRQVEALNQEIKELTQGEPKSED